MEFFLTPTLATGLIYTLGIVLAVIYMATRKEKSNDTRLLLAALSVFVTYGLINLLYNVTHTHVIVSGPAFFDTPLIPWSYWVLIMVFLTLMGVIVYRVGYAFRPAEERFAVAPPLGLSEQPIALVA